jgi:putative ABC transport system substrate-binding protein
VAFGCFREGTILDSIQVTTLTEGDPMRLHSVRGTVTLALALLLAPLAADAQPPTKVFRIGLLYGSSPLPGTAEAFRQGLRDLGYVEGQHVVIEQRWAERSEERLRELATELVQLPVDVLVAQGGLYTLRAAKDATSTIPIVMVGASDPVGQGFVASLAQPGGNITGTSSLQADVDGKRLELLKEVVPHAARIAVLVNPALATIQQRRVDNLVAASRALGVELQVMEVRRADEFAGAFAAMQRAGARALLVMTDPVLFDRHISDLTALARQHQVPAIYPWRWFAEAGGLMSYAPNLPDMSRRAAYYVDRILQGTKPADLPVEQASKFEFVINLQTARALGLTIPQEVLLQATEVIQ